MNTMTTMGELFAEEEERLLAKAKREIAAEDAFWNSLTPAQQASVIEQRQAFMARFDNINSGDDSEEEEE